MKTLIFCGTPRENGNTMALLDAFLDYLEGEYKVIDVYHCNIQPCVDCRYCWKNTGCCINDEMQGVYEYVQECDNILIASPLYFSQLTGLLLTIASRLQTYFSARHFRKVEPIAKSKKGGVIIVGGGDGCIEHAYETACILLKHMNVKHIAPAVYSHNTNNIPSKEDKRAVENSIQLARYFNECQLMNINIKQYKNEYKSAISELISENSFVREDIIRCLEQWPQNGMVVEDGSGVLAVGVFTGEDKKRGMTLYVKPSRRKEGIGTMLLKALEDNMRSDGVEEIVCDFKVNELEKAFLHKSGYRCWFRSNFMSYTGDKLIKDDYEIINYEDKYYDECQKILSEAFHKMRLSVGIESTLSFPSEKEKVAYKENSENMFVLRDNNQIVAVAMLEDNEIDAVAVAVDKQGKGYGKNMVIYSVNKLLDRGCEKITLWVVEGNPAKFLYEKLGFTTERLHEFVIKSI